MRVHGGGGITKADIDAMTSDELNAEARRLKEHLDEEAKAHKEAVAKARRKRR